MKASLTQQSICVALLAGFLGALGAQNIHAQYTFNCGSDGTYGPMEITTNTTLDLPPDGKFNCTTITIASGATLNFTPNALNTPVYLLATGDVVINGTIDVSGSLSTSSAGGLGGPGGFAGGRPVFADLPAGDGHGPGAGRAGTPSGAAAYGTAASAPSTNNGAVYGSPLLVPLVGGSGGGGGGVSGGGGGAILVASNTRITIQGSVVSTSPSWGEYQGWGYGFGSGGAIRLVAPVVSGPGTMNVAGGQNNWGSFYGAGAGRVRIDCMDRRSLALSFIPDRSVVSIGGNMVVIPTNPPHLDITQVAGTNIVVGAGAAVSFTLPQESSTNQTVTVQASNFGKLVPIRVVLTPDNGPSASYEANIDNTVNPASVTVSVVVPVNTQVQINAWTR